MEYVFFVILALSCNLSSISPRFSTTFLSRKKYFYTCLQTASNHSTSESPVYGLTNVKASSILYINYLVRINLKSCLHQWNVRNDTDMSNTARQTTTEMSSLTCVGGVVYESDWGSYITILSYKSMITVTVLQCQYRSAFIICSILFDFLYIFNVCSILFDLFTFLYVYILFYPLF